MADKALCAIPNCDKLSYARKFCKNHYYQERYRLGRFPPMERPAPKPCAVEGCDKVAKTRGYCPKHYLYFNRNGTTEIKTTRRGDALKFCEQAARAETDDCILWPYKLADGRGYVRPPVPGLVGPYPRMSSSRYVCILAHGDGGDLHALHKCHNELCVNPRHLYWGTNLQNIRDKMEAGRQPRGSAISGAKLTEDQVREIKKIDRSVYESELSAARAIGPTYGVSPFTVKQIWRKRAWKWV